MKWGLAAQWAAQAALSSTRCATIWTSADVGGGKPPATGGRDNWNAEIFSPPHLSQGKRPRIGSVSPLDVAYGGSFLPSQRLMLLQSQR